MRNLVLSVFLTLWNLTLFSASWQVTNTFDSGPGSLREAILNASADDTIYFSPTLLSGANDTIKLNSVINISVPLVIKGLYSSVDSLYISGQNNCQIFNIDLLSSGVPVEYMILDSLCLTQGYHSQTGGALRFKGDSLYIRNSVFYHNSSDYDGGAIHASNTISNSNCLLEIVNSRFAFNTSLIRGGAIMTYCPGFFYMRVYNSKFEFNSMIGGNTFTDSGGGAFVLRGDSRSDLYMKNTIINDNYSDKFGGGMNVYSGDGHIQILMDSCIVSNNQAPFKNGGGMYINTYSFFERTIDTYINHCQFFNNISEQGGAINLKIKDGGHSTFDINYSTFSGNVATAYAGGAINSSVSWSNGSSDVYSTINVNYSTFNNNSSQMQGGAIASTVHAPLATNYDGESYVNISTSTFTENTAQTTGGAIYNYVYYYANYVGFPKKCYVDIEKSTIYNNHAPECGGVYNRLNNSPGNSFWSKFYSRSNIIAENTEPNIFNFDSVSQIYSSGFNMFGDTLFQGAMVTDSVLVDSADLQLSPLANYGGFTATMMPGIGSFALNKGDTTDFSRAQNWPISDSLRDSGAAENYCLGYLSDTVVACSFYISPSGNYTWYNSGTYIDTLFFVSGCDTLVETILTIDSIYQTQYDSVCYGDDFTFPDGTTQTNITGAISYQSILISINGCDSVITSEVSVLIIDTSTTQSGVVLSSNATGALYQWVDCNNSFVPIIGEINQSYTPTLTGDYAVIVTEGMCADTSACIHASFVGVNENIPVAILFPNPVNDHLNIQIIGGEGGYLLVLYDASGKVVSSSGSQIFSNDYIQISDLEPGLYLFELYDDKGEVILMDKLIVE